MSSQKSHKLTLHKPRGNPNFGTSLHENARKHRLPVRLKVVHYYNIWPT